MPASEAGASKGKVAMYRGESTKSTEQPGVGIFLTPKLMEAKEYARGRYAELGGEPIVKKVIVDVQNTIDINDAQKLWFKETNGKAFNMRGEKGVEIKQFLQSKGYDSIKDGEHLIAFSPEQIKSATGNRGTFDAGERNINYMPSDPKAPKAQPANRIQQQAPAMPGNRFMAPAASAGAKLSERFR